MKKILIVGANSAIATATARRYARDGAALYLLGRDEQRLQALQSDLIVRGAREVSLALFDACDTNSHGAVVQRAFEELGAADVVLVAHGSLPDQAACQAEVPRALREVQVNAVGTVSLLEHVAAQMTRRGGGCLAVISSVAGERGRQSNYVYGAAKSMVSTWLQGLRNRLHPEGVQVLDIRPGFVDTPMTAQFDKGPLWATPDKVAEDIERAVSKGRHLLYTPFFWRYIMWIIRLIPEPLFKRLKL